MDRNGFVRRLLTGALLFVLLAEWMRPLAQMSDVTGLYMVQPLLFTLAALMAVDVLRLSAVLAWTVKTLIVLSLPAMMYGHTSLADYGWWVRFGDALKQDGFAMLRLEWETISPELRTFLFVMSWAVVASCLFTAVLYKRFLLWFTAGTAVYLLCLGWWPGLDTFPGLLRATSAGLLLHAFHVPAVLQRVYGFRDGSVRVSVVWPVSIVALAGLSLVAGYALAEKQADAARDRSIPVWQSFGAFTNWGGGWFGEAARGKTGYGEDDSKLGGPLRSDDTPAFLAVTERPGGYWRGEAKTIYDGKGWLGRENDVYRYELGANLPNVLRSEEPAAGGGAIERIFYLQDEWLTLLKSEGYSDESVTGVLGLGSKRGRQSIFADGAVKRVEAVRTAGTAGTDGRTDGTAASRSRGEGAVHVDRLEGNYWLADTEETMTGYRIVTYGTKEGADSSGDAAVLTNREAEAALQLPEELPDRVRQLAERIAGPHDSAYDKAAAIERYLRGSYSYTLNPPEAPEQGDFVDRFLFGQKAGYCDYFSTAMAVMLRAAGIPARFVKGFAPGEPLDPSAHERLTERVEAIERTEGDSVPKGSFYTLVRSSDAHSWVEAFIPGRGWTAFDPTPGFIGSGTEGGLTDSGSMESVPALAKADGDSGLFNAAERVSPVKERLAKLGALGRGWMANTVRSDRLRSPILWGIFAIPIFALALRPIFRAGRIGLRMRLVAYACGIGGAGADTRLMERMLFRLLQADGVEGPGETLRETALRLSAKLEGQADDGVLAAIRNDALAAIELYEWLRFGPPGPSRLPAKRMLHVWKSVNGLRKAIRL